MGVVSENLLKIINAIIFAIFGGIVHSKTLKATSKLEKINPVFFLLLGQYSIHIHSLNIRQRRVSRGGF